MRNEMSRLCYDVEVRHLIGWILPRRQEILHPVIPYNHSLLLPTPYVVPPSAARQRSKYRELGRQAAWQTSNYEYSGFAPPSPFVSPIPQSEIIIRDYDMGIV